MKFFHVALVAGALALVLSPGAFASRFHVIHHMKNGVHHARVKLHHGHMHVHNMVHHGHM